MADMDEQERKRLAEELGIDPDDLGTHALDSGDLSEITRDSREQMMDNLLAKKRDDSGGGSRGS